MTLSDRKKQTFTLKDGASCGRLLFARGLSRREEPCRSFSDPQVLPGDENMTNQNGKELPTAQLDKLDRLVR